MKKLFLICICFSFSFIDAQHFDYHPADWPLLNDVDFKFKGGVKEVQATTYSMNEKEEKSEAWKKDILIFKNDLIYKWIQEDLQFKQNFTQVYNYEEGYHPKFKSREIFDAKHNLIDKATYVYDKEHSDKLTEIYIKEFTTHIAEAPPIEYKVDVVLDKNGKRQEDIYYSPTGLLKNKIKLTYYDNGLIASKQRYDREKNWVMTDSIVYDSKLKKTKDIVVYPNQNPTEDPVLVSMEYTYGKNGFIQTFKLQETEIEFVYKLDDKGNWIERRSYILEKGQRKPYQFIERKIIYK